MKPPSKELVHLGKRATAFGKQIQWSEALALLSEAVRRGPSPDVTLFNIVVNVCDRGLQWHRSLHLFRQMRSLSCFPDEASYSSCMTALSRSSRWELALEIWEEVQQKLAQGSLKGNTFVYNSAMAAYEKANFWRQTLNLLEAVTAAKLQPDTIGFNTAMSSCTKEQQWQTALQLATALKTWSAATYSVLMTAWGTGGHWIYALRLFYENDSLKANSLALGALLSALKDNSQWRHALQVFQDVDGYRSSDAVCWSTLLGSCAQAAVWQEALQAFHVMKAKKLPLQAMTYSAVMSALEKAHRWRDALNIFEEMANPPTPQHDHISAVNSAIQACVRGVQWETSLHLLSKVAGPDEITYSGVLLALTYAPTIRLSQAVALYVEAREKGVLSLQHPEAGTIDLHYYPSEVATLAVFSSLLGLLTDACHGRPVHDLTIVVGAGHHSGMAGAKVGPAVAQLLCELGIPMQRPRTGRLRVPATALQQ